MYAQMILARRDYSPNLYSPVDGSRLWRRPAPSASDRKSPEKDVGGARRRARRVRLPTAVGSQLSCAASLLTSVTPQRATILAAGGKERARGPVGLPRRGRAKGVAVGSRDRPTHVGRDPTPWLVRAGGLTELIFASPAVPKSKNVQAMHVFGGIERRNGLPEARQTLFLAQGKGSMPAGLRISCSDRPNR